MRGLRRWNGWPLLMVAVALGLLSWTLVEAKRQRREVEEALSAEGARIAAALGPGLVAASSAARELDEIVLWRLLDNARWIAQLGPNRLDEERLGELGEANGLDSITVFSPAGEILAEVGEPLSLDTLEGIGDLLSGRAEEAVLGTALTGEVEHLTAGVRGVSDGAVVVQVHASAARTFAERLGVSNLLGQLVGSEGVLYLSYREEPGDTSIADSWDGGELPVAGATGLREIRGRVAFETEVPVEALAGRVATLRVGLDGSRLRRTGIAAQRRTLLVGLVLLAFTIAGTAYAAAVRLRARERAEAERRLAEADAARRRSERLAAAGALTAGLAHEVRSPLNAIGLAAQRLERRLESEEADGRLARRIRGEVTRLEHTLREFLDLARPVSDERARCDLADLAREVVELVQVEAQACGVAVGPVEGAAVAPVDCEAVRRAILNLLRNAVQASSKGGRVDVMVRESGGVGVIRVLDRGHGLDPRLAERLFDAFVTGRASGTGLGLALVRRVADEHGGEVRLDDREGGGAVAELRLPLTREPEEEA